MKNLSTILQTATNTYKATISKSITFREDCIREYYAIRPNRCTYVDLKPIGSSSVGILTYTVMLADHNTTDTSIPELQVEYNAYGSSDEFSKLIEVF